MNISEGSFLFFDENISFHEFDYRQKYQIFDAREKINL